MTALKNSIEKSFLLEITKYTVEDVKNTRIAIRRWIFTDFPTY